MECPRTPPRKKQKPNKKYIKRMYTTYLTPEERQEHSEQTLLTILNNIEWTTPQKRRGTLCLRKPWCSVDCVGCDCGTFNMKE